MSKKEKNTANAYLTSAEIKSLLKSETKLKEIMIEFAKKKREKELLFCLYMYLKIKHKPFIDFLDPKLLSFISKENAELTMPYIHYNRMKTLILLTYKKPILLTIIILIVFVSLISLKRLKSK